MILDEGLVFSPAPLLLKRQFVVSGDIDLFADCPVGNSLSGNVPNWNNNKVPQISLFIRFNQLDISVERRSGTGLGLAISKQNINRL